MQKFVNDDGSFNLETNVIQITRTTLKMFPNLILNNTFTDCGEVVFYPKDYFCPIDYVTKKRIKTKNTCTIHWFSGSWIPHGVKIKMKIFNFLNFISFGLFVRFWKKIKKEKSK